MELGPAPLLKAAAEDAGREALAAQPEVSGRELQPDSSRAEFGK